MSAETHESGRRKGEQRRRKRRSGDRSRDRSHVVPRWAYVVAGVLGLVLLVNIVLALPALLGDGEARALITPDTLRGASVWIPAGGAIVLGLFGIVWTTRGLERRRSQANLWRRTAFAASIVSVGILLFAIYEQNAFPREDLAIVAAVAVALPTILFAAAAASDGGRRSRGGAEDKKG